MPNHPYRRNSDDFIRRAEKMALHDPCHGITAYMARRRAGVDISLKDFRLLADCEMAGRPIPYHIDLMLEFPFGIAREIWLARPSIQAYYRVRKVQNDAIEALTLQWVEEQGIGWNEEDPYYSLPAEFRRGPYREFRRNLKLSLSPAELAELWARDIESHLRLTRETLTAGIHTQYQRNIDGLIAEQRGSKPEIVKIYYDINNETNQPQPLKNGALFSLKYGRDCCYDTPNYLGGSVHIQVFGSGGSSGYRPNQINVAIVEYGRHYGHTIPPHIIREELQFNSYGIISDAWPTSYTPTQEELQARKYLIPNIPLHSVVNGEHLFDLLRIIYEEKLPEYKKTFENNASNQKLIQSKYYHPHYSHIWQISKLVSDRVELLDILGVSHLNGKIPKDAHGDFHFQQYKFKLYPSRGNNGKLARLYVICPITNTEVSTGRWNQYAASLLKEPRPDMYDFL